MVRTEKQAVKIFPAEGGFRILRRTSREQAALQEKMGVLRAEFDQANGMLVGFRVVGVELRKVDSDLRSIHTTASISANEMELNCARSRTAGLSERMRLERAARGEEPEDRVERVRAKVRVYAVIGAQRGDVLRVWPR